MSFLIVPKRIVRSIGFLALSPTCLLRIWRSFGSFSIGQVRRERTESEDGDGGDVGGCHSVLEAQDCRQLPASQMRTRLLPRPFSLSTPKEVASNIVHVDIFPCLLVTVTVHVHTGLSCLLLRLVVRRTPLMGCVSATTPEESLTNGTI